MTEISFTKLSSHHLHLLLKWLEAPHVKAWWDQDVVYNETLVKEKFGKNIDNVTTDNGLTIAYIILCDNNKIGYIQYYDAASWLIANHVEFDPVTKIIGLDLFIGEEDYYDVGLGSLIIDKFYQRFIKPSACMVDPSRSNIRAIQAYGKAGFKLYVEDNNICWMMKDWKNEGLINANQFRTKAM